MKQKCIEKKIEILNEEIFDLAKEIPSLFIPLLAQDFRKISLMQLNSFP